MNLKSVSKNFFFLVISQLLALFFNVLIGFLFPKFMDFENFGFWQLFLFYASFCGLFHLGLIDGIYLRYGGKQYSRINKELLLGQLIILLFFLLLVGLMVLTSMFLFADVNQNYFSVILGVISIGIIINLYTFITTLQQSINHIKQFSAITTFVNIVLFASFIIAFLLKNYGFQNYIILYNVAYFLGFLVCLYFVRDFFINNNLKKIRWKSIWIETKKNISVGSNLLISNIASLLILGVGRFAIEKKWGILEFGKISFAIALMGFFIFFIRQIGVVLFPLLKNKNKDYLKDLFNFSKVLLNVLLLGLLLLYPLLELFVSYFIPKYSSSIFYLIIILPAFIYEGKMQVLYSTYMKVLRKEKQLLYANVFVMLISSVFCFAGYLIGSIPIIVISISLSISIRSLILDKILKKYYGLKRKYEELILILFSSFFVVAFLSFDLEIGFLIYLGLYFVYVVIYKKDLQKLIQFLKLQQIKW